MDAPRFAPPAAVRDIVRRLERAGFEAWCVGGAVRDALLGIDSLDWDVATSATPDQVQRLFRRTVPVGIAFGTVGVLDAEGVLHEVTTFRRDVRTDGRHAEVVFGASLDEDLARRDFTINAIAVHPETLAVRDPFRGRDDLAAGVVRAVGVPLERMVEDRLRALRALRFAARFGFRLDPATWEAIVASAPHLGRLSMERVKQELDKVLEQVARPSTALRWYRDAGIFRALLPALGDVADATLDAVAVHGRPGLAGRPDRRTLRWAALLADDPDPEQTLRALRASNAEAKTVARWVGALQALAPLVPVAPGTHGHVDDAQLRRAAARCGRLATRAVARLLLARARGGAPTEGRALYRRALRIAWHDPIEVADLAVDGEDLRRAGVGPGPAIGDTLRRLLDAVLDDPRRNTREQLLALVG